MAQKSKPKKPKTTARLKAGQELPANNVTAPLLEEINRAYFFLRQRRTNDAELVFHTLLNRQSNDPVFLDRLGVLAHMLGKSGIGANLLRQSIQIRPSAGAYNNLGLILEKTGALDAAQNSYEVAVQLDSGFAAAFFNLANILHKKSLFESAIKNYRQAILLQPDYLAAYCNLAKTQERLDLPEEAKATCFKAMQVEPTYDHVMNPSFADTIFTWCGIILSQQGRAHVWETIEKELESVATKFPIYFQIGNFLSKQGINDEAGKAFLNSLEGFNKSGWSGWSGWTCYYISKLKNFRPGDKEIQAMEDAYASASDQANRAYTAYALGKISEDIGEYSKAFQYISEGNRYLRTTYHYSIQEDYNFFAGMKSAFNRSYFEKMKDAGLRDPTPIFIIGMPRSGTTLVEQILASHSQVYGAGELNDFSLIVRNTFIRAGAGKVPEGIAQLTAQAIEQMGSQYVSLLRSHDRKASRIINKLPFNYLWAGFIRLALPDATIIHCKRDPMDTCWSIYKNIFGSTPVNFAQDLTELGQYYRLYRDIMDHWHKTIPGVIHDVEYEQLIEDQENETRKLLKLCNLNWEDACLDFHKTKRQVATCSMAQVRNPIYNDSVQKWRHFEKELMPLFDIIYG